MQLLEYLNNEIHEYISIYGKQLSINDYIEIDSEYQKVLSVKDDGNYIKFEVKNGYYDLSKKGRYSVYRLYLDKL